LGTVSPSTSITFTDSVTASITATQSGIIVTPGAIAKFVVSGLTSPIVAGTNETAVTVTAEDAFNNVKTDYVGTVHFTATGTSTLPADYTFLAAELGVHTFAAGSVVLKTSGSQTVTVADTAVATAKGSQAGIVVQPAAAKTLTV